MAIVFMDGFEGRALDFSKVNAVKIDDIPELSMEKVLGQLMINMFHTAAAGHLFHEPSIWIVGDIEVTLTPEGEHDWRLSCRTIDRPKQV